MQHRLASVMMKHGAKLSSYTVVQLHVRNGYQLQGVLSANQMKKSMFLVFA